MFSGVCVWFSSRRSLGFSVSILGKGQIPPISAVRAVPSSKVFTMRSPFDPQLRLGSTAIVDIPLNTRCRDEIIPILAALKHLYSQPVLRDEILDAVAHDVNACSSPDHGRPGMDYWPILVLAAVRLGCNLNYDKLQNLAEEHRTLRAIMGVDGWDRDNTFDWRLLHDNISLVS